MNDDWTAATWSRLIDQRTVRVSKMIEHTIILIRSVSTVESSVSASRRPRMFRQVLEARPLPGSGVL